MALTLHYDFINDRTLTAKVGQDLPCSRTTTGTYMNSSGVLEEAAINTPRFGYYADGTSRGLLIEGTATNVQIYSNDQGSTGGGTNQCTIDTSAGTSPDGTNNAQRINVTAGTGVEVRAGHGARVINTNTDYANTVFVKADGCSHAYLNIISSANRWYTIVVRFSDGTITHEEDGSSATFDNSTIEEWGNGWYRIGAHGNLGATTSSNIVLGVCDSDSPSLSATTGRPTYDPVEGEDLLFFGAQMEAGLFPSSYIPTEASTVLRARDECAFADGDVIVPADTPCTLYLDVEFFFPEVGTGGALNLSKTGGLQGPMVYGVVNGTYRWTYWEGGNNIAIGAFESDDDITANTRYRTAIGIDTSDTDCYCNGELMGSDGAVTLVDDDLDSFGIRRESASVMPGYYKEIRIYDERLDDSTLERFSNGNFGWTDEEIALYRRKRARLVQRYRRR